MQLLVLFGYVTLACFGVLLIRPYYFVSILLVLGPPSLANFLLLKKSRFKILLFASVSTLLFAPPVELATRLANAWDVQSIFPRPFGLIPWENMLFAFINFFWVLAFYEYFVDRDTNAKISKNFKYLVWLYVIFAAIIFAGYYYARYLVASSYFAMSIPILILPGAIIFFKRPQLLKKTVLPMLFFAAVFFIYEVISIIVGSWWWPGHYVLAVHPYGITFPIDDVVIWYLLSTPALIGGYEFFADDWS